MTFTPGPWRAYKDASLRHTIGTAYVRICDMWGRDPAVHSDEDAANARLIAAAPDLMRWLQSLVDRVSWGDRGLPRGDPGFDDLGEIVVTPSDYEELRAVLAKATTGGQKEEE